MIVFKKSKSDIYGQWTILLLPTCFGIIKFQREFKLQCSAIGFKLLHITTPPHNVFSKFQK